MYWVDKLLNVSRVLTFGRWHIYRRPHYDVIHSHPISANNMAAAILLTEMVRWDGNKTTRRGAELNGVGRRTG